MEKENFNNLCFIICIGFILTIFTIYGGISDIKHKIDENRYIYKTDTVIVHRPLVREVTITVYHSIKEQCDSNPLITANGTKIDLVKLKNKEIKYCAVSQDLVEMFPYGSIIYIEGYGEYEVVDTMNKRIKNTVDILQDINEPIFKKTGIKIIKL